MTDVTKQIEASRVELLAKYPNAVSVSKTRYMFKSVTDESKFVLWDVWSSTTMNAFYVPASDAENFVEEIIGVVKKHKKELVSIYLI